MAKETNQHLNDARNNALLALLMNTNATPAAVNSWMIANVTTMAQAQQVLTALALGLRYVYMRDL